MSLTRSWQFVGDVGGWPYRFFDALRRRVNRRLVRFLTQSLEQRQTAENEGGGRTSADRGWRVMEAGSGTAFATSLFADDARTVAAVCLDSDEEALRAARVRDPRVLAVVGDLRAMPFRDGAFTLVFNSSTLEHLDRPLDGLKEMTRVCHSQGRVFVGVPYAAGPLGFQPLIRRTPWGTWIGPVFSRRALDVLLRRAGLTVESGLTYFWRFFIGAVARRSESVLIERRVDTLEVTPDSPMPEALAPTSDTRPATRVGAAESDIGDEESRT